MVVGRLVVVAMRDSVVAVSVVVRAKELAGLVRSLNIIPVGSKRLKKGRTYELVE